MWATCLESPRVDCCPVFGATHLGSPLVVFLPRPTLPHPEVLKGDHAVWKPQGQQLAPVPVVVGASTLVMGDPPAVVAQSPQPGMVLAVPRFRVERVKVPATAASTEATWVIVVGRCHRRDARRYRYRRDTDDCHGGPRDWCSAHGRSWLCKALRS
jgi:hypothetical protein